jgi:adenylate cyclase
MPDSPPGAKLSRQDAAGRAGVDPDFVEALIENRILKPDAAGLLTLGDVRRAGILRSIIESGIPIEAVGEGMQRGILSLDFVDSPEYERFAGLAGETFEEASARTGVPVAHLTTIREAVGAGQARPEDRVREDELPLIGFVEIQQRVGFRWSSTERLLRAMSDSLRKIAESEAEWWRAEVLRPNLEAGRSADSIGGEYSAELNLHSRDALLATWHAQQALTWTANIIGGFSYLLDAAGIHRPTQRDPAICFLDITGYTRLTQERGDQAAADLAETLNRLVKRSSMEHGGRPVKWLGDGVMFHFPDPGPGVLAALEMVDGVAGAGLPPAHVGLDSGAVVMQEGDFYGQTVNKAARIADYARPGEVLVTQAIVDASTVPGLRFSAIGDVELKGVSGAVALHSARRADATAS